MAGSAQSRQVMVKVGECWALCTERDFKLPTEQLPHSVLVFTIHLKGHLFFHSVFITFTTFNHTLFYLCGESLKTQAPINVGGKVPAPPEPSHECQDGRWRQGLDRVGLPMAQTSRSPAS